MTTLEVIDTGIKIGLGAIISGVATYITIKAGHSHELRKEHLRRRQDTIERLIETFESFDTFFADIHANHLSIFRRSATAEQDRQILLKLFDSVELHFKAFRTMEGKLLLLGLTDCEATAKQYRGCAVTIYDMASGVDSDVTEKKLEVSIGALLAGRNKFYALMFRHYKDG